VGEVFDTVLGTVLIPVVASVLLTWGVCAGETVGLALLLGVGVPLDGVVAMVTELVVPDEDETTDDADGPDEETDEVVQVEEEDEPPFGFEMPNCVEY